MGWHTAYSLLGASRLDVTCGLWKKPTWESGRSTRMRRTRGKSGCPASRRQVAQDYLQDLLGDLNFLDSKRQGLPPFEAWVDQVAILSDCMAE